jgi:lysophospholipase L1-like esterase
VKRLLVQYSGHGDRNLHYLSGLKLFNESDLDLLPDGLHPSAEGYQLMGVRAVEHLLPTLGLIR